VGHEGTNPEDQGIMIPEFDISLVIGGGTLE
jgi:hypothetical protein